MFAQGVDSSYSVPFHVQYKNTFSQSEKINHTESKYGKSEEKKTDSVELEFNKLSDEDKKKLEELKKRDQEVKSHEEAHRRAAGSIATAPQYEYETGPDGKQYAVGGSVQLDTSKEDTPEKTIAKAQTIQRAAMAPESPSSQDRKVAQQASQMEAKARAELMKKRQDALRAYQPNQSEQNQNNSSVVDDQQMIKNDSDEEKIIQTGGSDDSSTMDSFAPVSKLDYYQDIQNVIQLSHQMNLYA